MSWQHVQQKLDGRHALHEIFMSVRYLCRKGLPLQGDKVLDEKSDPDLHRLVTRYQMHKCSQRLLPSLADVVEGQHRHTVCG